jgi:hypothetical protein
MNGLGAGSKKKSAAKADCLGRSPPIPERRMAVNMVKIVNRKVEIGTTWSAVSDATRKRLILEGGERTL